MRHRRDAGEQLAVLRIFELLGVKVTLHETDEDRRVARILRDFLAAAFLAGELAEARDDRRHELEHDARADVGDDAQGEDRAILQRAAAEKIEHADNSVVLVRLDDGMEELGQDLGINAGTGNGRTDANDDDDREREENPLAQFRNLEDVRECREHENE